MRIFFEGTHPGLMAKQLSMLEKCLLGSVKVAFANLI